MGASMQHRYRVIGVMFSVTAMLLSACGKNDQQKADSVAAAAASGAMAVPADSSAMGGMGGMAKRGTDSTGAMAGMSGTTGMSAEMIAHMSTMKAADGAKMKSMLSEHRSMITKMLATMNDQMTQMKMPATAAWTALSDSIRSDLKKMPDQSAQALASMMPAHEMRITNLATMHDEMMKGIKSP